jgi:Cu/Ag efflux pump CusA
MGYATLVVLLAALPIFFIGGTTGSFFDPLARSYALAALASMLVALTVTPALGLSLLSKTAAEGRESPLLRWPRRHYDNAVSRIIARPRVAFIAAGLVALAGLAMLPTLGGPVIPSFKDRDFLVHFDGPPGTSRPEMSRIVSRASRELSAIPGVSKVAGHVGRATTGDQIVDVNSSELWIRVDPDADYGETKASIQSVVDGYPGLTHNVSTYEKQRIRDVAAVDDKQAADQARQGSDLNVLTGDDHRPLLVRVYGEDLRVLRQQGTRIEQLLSKVDGVVDPRLESQPQDPIVAIEVNLDKAQRYGIKAGDVRRRAATLLQGIQVGSLFEKQKVFDVVVRATPEARRSLTDIRRLLIDIPSGGHVRLGTIASVRIRPTPAVIQRESSSRRVDVTADVKGRGVGAVQDDVRREIRKLSFPLEYHAQVIGNADGHQATAMRLIGFGIAAAIGIFLLLQAAFASWRLASLVLLTLPLALVGGELAGLIDGGTFSLGALAGLLTVFGVAARNCIGLIRHYQQLEQREGEAFGPGLFLRGARERFAPIVVSAAATGLALTPFVFLGTRPGFEIVHPMAVVVLGGLVTSTLLSLLFVPALYSRFASKAAPGLTDEDALLHRWASAESDPGTDPTASGADRETATIALDADPKAGGN